MAAKTKIDSLVLNSLGQMKALAEPVRYRIFELLTLEARTAKQAAELMGMKPTSLYHHFGVLEKAGLIKKVKTQKKRGTTEKYFEAVADKIVLKPNLFGGKVLSASPLFAGVFQSTLEEIAETERAASEASPIWVNRLRIRTTPAKARTLQRKLKNWIKECQAVSNRSGDTEYGITVALYEVSETPSEERNSES